MRELKIGDWIKDNDPRMPNRTAQVAAIKQHGMVTTHSRPMVAECFERHGSLTRPIRIRVDRIHTDGKPRRSGWSLIEDAENA